MNAIGLIESKLRTYPNQWNSNQNGSSTLRVAARHLAATANSGRDRRQVLGVHVPRIRLQVQAAEQHEASQKKADKAV